MFDRYRRFYKSQKYTCYYKTLLCQIVIITALILALIWGVKNEKSFALNFVSSVNSLQEFPEKIYNKNQKSEILPNEISLFQKEIPEDCCMNPILLSHQMIKPVNGEITCPFGFRNHPITGKTDFHRGIDIAVPVGTDIHAVLDGEAEEIGEDRINGKYIVINHGNGLKTIYCHCEEILAPISANIRRGERIAKSGNTGLSTGPHLHFAVMYQNKYYDPLWVEEYDI